MNEKLKNWVAVGELVAAAGVMVSLIFVGFELNSGNKIQQATNDNVLYELQDAMYADLSTNPVLSSAYIKLSDGVGELTREERAQYAVHLWRNFNHWSLAFDRHEEGLLSDATWTGWNDNFELDFVGGRTGLPKRSWENSRDTFARAFAAYVDSVYMRLENPESQD